MTTEVLEIKARLRHTAYHVQQDAFIKSTSKRIIIRAGRRGGKTLGVAQKAVLAFLNGLRVLYAAPTGEQTDRAWFEAKRALEEFLKTPAYKVNENERYIEKIGTLNRIKFKAQPLTSKIYTPDGYKLMGDLKVGDPLLTPFGTVTTVAGIYPQGEQDIYEITFGDGAKAECTADHLWEIYNLTDSKQHRGKYVIAQTSDLFNNGKINHDSKHLSHRPRIRLTMPVLFNKQTVPLDPYLLGVLLGDGTLSKNCSPRLSTSDMEILDTIKPLLPSGVTIQYCGNYDYRLALHDKPRKNNNGLLSELKRLGLIGKRSNEKFIPDIYKYNTEDVRIKIIQGLLDTDGTVTNNGRPFIVQTSKRLADDIAEIIQSLGGLCSTIKGTSGYTTNNVYKECKPIYRQYIIYDGKHELFTLSRKKSKHTLRTLRNSNVNRSIRSVQLKGRAQCQCIKVCDIRQLYLTDYFIVTHNTAWNANTLRGDFADLLILDEYQLMAEDTWEDVGQPMLADNNGNAVFIYTPPSLIATGVSKARDPRHASKLFRKAQADTTGLWETFHFSSWENPYISHEALDLLSKEMSIDSYRREILAEDDEVEKSWLVYQPFDAVTCMINPIPLSNQWPRYVFHDFGQANPAALFVAQDPGTGYFYEYEEYLPGAGVSAPQHIEAWKKITEGTNVIKRIGGNWTTEKETRELYTAHGWPIQAPKIHNVKAQLDRELGLMNLNKIFIFNTLKNRLNEIARCMWVLDDENRPTDKIKNEARFHLCAAGRYGYSDFVPQTVVGGTQPFSFKYRE